MRVPSPCKNCNDRKTLCHSTCEKYLNFKRARDEERIARAKYLNLHRPIGFTPYREDDAHNRG